MDLSVIFWPMSMGLVVSSPVILSPSVVPAPAPVSVLIVVNKTFIKTPPARPVRLRGTPVTRNWDMGRTCSDTN